MSHGVAAGAGPPEAPPRKAPIAGMVPRIESAACAETGDGARPRPAEAGTGEPKALAGMADRA